MYINKMEWRKRHKESHDEFTIIVMAYDKNKETGW